MNDERGKMKWRCRLRPAGYGVTRSRMRAADRSADEKTERTEETEETEIGL